MIRKIYNFKTKERVEHSLQGYVGKEVKIEGVFYLVDRIEENEEAFVAILVALEGQNMLEKELAMFKAEKINNEEYNETSFDAYVHEQEDRDKVVSFIPVTHYCSEETIAKIKKFVDREFDSIEEIFEDIKGHKEFMSISEDGIEIYDEYKTRILAVVEGYRSSELYLFKSIKHMGLL